MSQTIYSPFTDEANDPDQLMETDPETKVVQHLPVCTSLTATQTLS